MPLLLMDRLAKRLKWALAAGLLCGAGFVLSRWTPSPEPIAAGGAVGRAAPSDELADDANIELEAAVAERLGVATTLAHAREWTRAEQVYGRIVSNPRAETEIHAAASGRLHEATASWPTLGQHLSSGRILGRLQIRVSPEVRLDLKNKLSAARQQLRGEEEIVKVHTQTVEDLRKITDRAILSRAELDTALVILEEAKIQEAIARAAVELWEKSLREIDDVSADGGTLWNQPIITPREGTVVDLAVRPGMDVEAGSVLMRLEDYRRPLVRLAFPPELLSGGAPPSEVEVEVATTSTSALQGIGDSSKRRASARKHPARLVGPAPMSDATSQLVGIWYEVQLAQGENDPPTSVEALWRPGLQVLARFSGSAAPESAIAVPAAAVLFHDGRSLVYVRTTEDRYQRREVQLLQRDGDDWIIAAFNKDVLIGVADGDQVVSRQAQVLLSNEFLRGGGDAD